jgi:uncharacterized tellurite resistance protein B-like protein
MIIWGSKGRTATIASGEFHCPDCSDYKLYKHQKVKRWFTLYFIPVFPMEDLGEYIECGDCKSTYKNNVLENDPKKKQEQIQALFVAATRDIMLKIILADGVVEDSEIDQVIKTFALVTKREISLEQVTSAIEDLQKDGSDIKKYAGAIAPFLNDVGKEMVLRGAIAVAKSDGVVHEEELKMLHSLALAVDLPRAYANGIFGEEKITFLK